MPALTPGHSFHEVYKQTIERLRHAATKASNELKLLVTYGILNEVVSHRRLAVDAMAVNGGAFGEELKREVMFDGSSQSNVFVGAYANLRESDSTLKFNEFLQRYAPFTDEASLEKWLVGKGIGVIKDNEAKGVDYAALVLSLEKEYSQQLASGKDVRLIDHDAIQLSALAKDRANSKRAILVSADKRLRDVVSKGPIPQLATHMVSHVGLTQFIDLLVGNINEPLGMTELLWSAKASSKSEAVRAYLIAVTLEKRDEALAMAMPDLIDKTVDAAVIELDRLGLDPLSQDSKKRSKALRVVGTYEKSFFEAMREIIERRLRQGK